MQIWGVAKRVSSQEVFMFPLRVTVEHAFIRQCLLVAQVYWQLPARPLCAAAAAGG